jgi:NADPH:quinone reductase-like Zn-dependent oxidoreductase
MAGCRPVTASASRARTVVSGMWPCSSPAAGARRWWRRGSHYFVVEPNHEQLLELAWLVDTGDLWPEIDSVFPLAQAQAAFMRSAARGKHGKVVLGVIE